MTVGTLILVLVAAPLLAVIGCLLVRQPRWCEAINLVASAVSFVCALPLPFLVDGQAIAVLERLRPHRPALGLGHPVHVDRLLPRLDLCRRLHAAAE